MATFRNLILSFLLLSTLLVLITPCVWSNDLAAGALSAKYYWLYGTTLFGGVCLSVALLLRRLQVRLADMLVMGFLLYLVLLSCLTGAELLMVRKWWQFLSGVMLYFMIRYLLQTPACIRKYAPVLLLLLTGTVWLNLFMGLLQFTGWVPSLNYYHPVTGTFFHPAPFAMLLSAVFPIIVYITIYYSRGVGWDRWLYLSAVPLCLFIPVGLYFLDSRAAWIAAAAGMLLVLPAGVWMKRWFPAGWRRWGLAGIMMLMLSAALYAAFLHRPASVSGRLLVWKISAGMLAEKPLTGFGLDRFREQYPWYQIRYFSQEHYTANEALLADEVTSAFSEPLQLAVETGIPGALLLIGIAGYTIFQCMRQSRQEHSMSGLLTKGGGGALLSFATFALSSYPLSLAEGVVLFFAFMALAVSGMGRYMIFPGHRFLGILLLLFAAGGFILMSSQAPQKWKEVKAYNQWRIADTTLDTTLAGKHYAAAQTVLSGNELFAAAYARFLFRSGAFAKSMSVLQQIKGARYEDLLLRGRVAGKLGNYNDAVMYFAQAHLLIPHRFVPLFHLMETFYAAGDVQRAIVYAAQIRDMPVKVESMQVYTIKDAAVKILAQKNN